MLRTNERLSRVTQTVKSRATVAAQLNALSRISSSSPSVQITDLVFVRGIRFSQNWNDHDSESKYKMGSGGCTGFAYFTDRWQLLYSRWYVEKPMVETGSDLRHLDAAGIAFRCPVDVELCVWRH